MRTGTARGTLDAATQTGAARSATEEHVSRSESTAAQRPSRPHIGLVLLLLSTLAPQSPLGRDLDAAQSATGIMLHDGVLRESRSYWHHELNNPWGEIPLSSTAAPQSGDFSEGAEEVEPQQSTKQNKQQDSTHNGQPQRGERRRLKGRLPNRNRRRPEDDEDELIAAEEGALIVSDDGRSNADSQDMEVASRDSRSPSSSFAQASTPSTSSVRSVPQGRRLRSLHPAVLAEALSFLPLRDIDAARDASSVLAAAANYVAPHPIAGSSDAVFVRFTVAPAPMIEHLPSTSNGEAAKPLSRRAKAAALKQQDVPFVWRCTNCNAKGSDRKRCLSCGALIGEASCRVFLGQLPKEHTAELATFMLRSIAPHINVTHVESHTNGRDGRGKGCAWVYVDSVNDALELTDLHRRVFVDVDADGYSGFWFVRDSQHTPNLQNVADAVGGLATRPPELPRNLLVAELQHR